MLYDSFHTASLGDPTLEVELEQEKETKKVRQPKNLESCDKYWEWLICMSFFEMFFYFYILLRCWRSNALLAFSWLEDQMGWDGKSLKSYSFSCPWIQVSNSLIANLRTGDRLLRLQSKKTLKHNMTLSNSYMTNLRYAYCLSATCNPFFPVLFVLSALLVLHLYSFYESKMLLDVFIAFIIYWISVD